VIATINILNAAPENSITANKPANFSNISSFFKPPNASYCLCKSLSASQIISLAFSANFYKKLSAFSL